MFLKKALPKIVALSVSFLLVAEQPAFAQVGMVALPSQSSAANRVSSPEFFHPCHLRALSYDRLTGECRFFLDQGTTGNAENSDLENANRQLLNYFFIGLSLPNQAFWVNLRPGGEENIIDPLLAQTDLGKVLLESDLRLKQDTARLTSPDTSTGKLYWDKLYKKAEELFGSEDVSIPTLTRPWIVPGEIIVRESPDSAYIYKASMKVMLEQDYLGGSREYSFADARMKELNDYSTELIRRIILPRLTREINSSRRYAPLRQAYYSLIMAQWFKSRFAGNAGKYARIMNCRVLGGLVSASPWSKDAYFHAYEKSFRQGEYNTQAVAYTASGRHMRSYFSGGMDLANTEKAFFSIPASESLDGGTRSRVNLRKLRWDRLLMVAVMIGGLAYGTVTVVIPPVKHAFQAAATHVEFGLVHDYSGAIKLAEMDPATPGWESAVEELGQGAGVGKQEAIDCLLSLAQTGATEFVQLTAVKNLILAAQDGNAQVIGYLINAAQTSALLDMRLTALHVMGEAVGEDMPEIVQALENVAGHAQTQAEKTVAIAALGYAAEEGNTQAFSILQGFAANETLGLDMRREAIEALPVSSHLQAQTRDRLSTLVKDADYPALLRAASFNRLVSHDLIGKGGIRELVPYLAQINQDEDHDVQRLVANIVIVLLGKEGKPLDAEPLSGITDAASIEARETMRITAGNKTSGSYDRWVVEHLARRAIYQGVDPRLVEGIMLVEGPIVLNDPNAIEYMKSYGEMFPGVIVGERECLYYPKEEVERALGSSGSSGEDVIVAVNYRADKDYDSHENAPCDIAVYPAAGLEEYGIGPEFIKETKYLFRVKNYDRADLSVKGNLGILYLKREVQDKIAKGQSAGLSPKAAITNFNGRPKNGTLAYGEKVLGIMDLLDNKEQNPAINKIFDEARRVIGKPVVHIDTGTAAKDGGGPVGREDARQLGGIDFTTLPITAQAAANLSAVAWADPLPVVRAFSRDLGSEWKRISQLVDAGMAPQAERIREYIQLSCYTGAMGRDAEKVAACIAGILRMEEERGLPTDPVLRDILVVIDSAGSVQGIASVFIGEKAF